MNLPEYTMTFDEQRALASAVANIDTAYTLLLRIPSKLVFWQAIVLGLAAEQVLWENNLRLVRRIARDEQRRGVGDYEELFQEGCIALRNAIRKFRPELGYRLSTYAHDSIARHIRHSADTGQYISDSRHFRRLRRLALEDKAPENINSIALARRVSSEALEYLADPTDQFETIHGHGVEFLDLLANNHAELLRKRYGIGCSAFSQAELAAAMGVSTSTISRWEQRALEEARRVLSAERMQMVA